MKDLLAAIKLELQNVVALDYVRDSDVFVAEHETILPPQLRFPAIGIKDGPITYKIATRDQENDTLLVKIVAYVQLQKPEAVIMGDAVVGLKGVLGMMADIRTTLKGNRFGGLVDSAWPEAETESEPLVGDEGLVIQMKILTMHYERY